MSEIDLFEWGEKRTFAVTYSTVKFGYYALRGKKRSRNGIICVLREVTGKRIGEPFTGLAIHKPGEKSDMVAAKRVAAKRAFTAWARAATSRLVLDRLESRTGNVHNSDPISDRFFNSLYKTYRHNRWQNVYRSQHPASHEQAEAAVEPVTDAV